MTYLDMKMKIQQIVEIHDNDTNEDYFLIEHNGEWLKTTKEEYNNIIRGKK